MLLSMTVASWPLPSSAQPDQHNQLHKTEIALFKYGGATNNGSQKFDVFRGMVDQKIRNLRQQVIQAYEPDDEFNYLKQLHIHYYDFDRFGPDSEVALWLVNQGVLSAMRGAINSDDGTHYSVYSQFYYEDISRPSPEVDIVSVELPIRGSEFANTVDTHSILILYMLALDARRLNPSSPQVSSLLSEASRLIANLEQRSGPVTGDLLRLKSSIQELENEILVPQ